MEERSRPVSRILSRPPPRGTGGDHLSWSRVAATLVQPTREHRAGHPLPAWPCSGWGLPSRPVTRPLVSSYLTVSPLPLLRLGLPPRAGAAGTPGSTTERWAVCLCGTFRGSPRLGVTQHPALWSPDFPRLATPKGGGRGRPAASSPVGVYGPYRSGSEPKIPSPSSFVETRDPS